MSDWYAHQFGDRDLFAISFSLGRHPHPQPGEAEDWGSFALWVRGRCLTRSVSADAGVAEAVHWHVRPLLAWLATAGTRLVNEEPFPLPTNDDAIRDACEWFVASEDPPLSLSEREEDDWFEARSEWQGHHALRQADLSVALPNVVIRRLGDFLEVSWDNERWGSPRSNLQFVERRGTEVVSARLAAQVILEAVRVVTSESFEGQPPMSPKPAKGTDWRWLVHQSTAKLVRTQLPSLDKRLSRRARRAASGFFVPHTTETLILRQARPTRVSEVQALLGLPTELGADSLTGKLADAVNPSPPSPVEPWREGYAYADEFRERMGWGDEPVPRLDTWLGRNNLQTRTRNLPGSVDVISVRTEDRHAGIFVSRTASPLPREMGSAMGLGHILMDPETVAIDGTWEHWPSAARARAFGVMLLLPDEGVRARLRGRKRVDAEAVRELMRHFRTGPHATTFHLKNRKLISDDERVTLLAELVA